ncbi:MAG: NAD(P)-dependent oxidoreductase [Pseudomonadota bacterium]|nr:NAD(P)-dependent oxidoreductase [Pseudomonadota bacterium]
MPSLKGRTVFITGGSRGIGRALALRCAQDGANIIIAAKSVTPHPTLDGTIYSVAAEIEAAGGQALPLQVDVREQQQVIDAMAQAAERFGGIDLLVNNAGALHVGGVETTPLKKYDLIQTVNHRATFVCAQAALPYLKRSDHAQILSFSPPINLAPHWLGAYSPYALSKYGMTLLTLGMAEEFKSYGIACNTLWPTTLIATDAVSKTLGIQATELMSRRPSIMADAAYSILSGAAGSLNGQTLLDEQALCLAGITDFLTYACTPEQADQIAKDLFVD